MQLLRCLTFIQAKYQFNLLSTHIKGIDNDVADALSLANVRHFFSRRPKAQTHPTPLPAELLDLTVVRKPDWTSQLWTDLWSATFGQD